ncbi:MAG: hypothetical protein GVY14_10745 [Spirochaetes bacterium]|nr:hypothetical protein [Spirochaetota bacterium]
MEKIGAILGGITLLLFITGCPSPLGSDSSGDSDNNDDTAQYSVTYDANGADSGTVPEDQTKVEGTDLTLATNSGELKQTEYIFDGWNTKPDGSGTTYAAGADYSGDADVTLYADWRHIGVKPAITDVTFEGPATIDTSSGDQVVTFIVEAEDDMELYDASMWVGDPSSNRSVYWTDDGYEGTDNSGKFTFEVVIPQDSEPGTWTLSEVTVRDHLMKRTDLNSLDLATQGWNHTFEQTGDGDTEYPTISNVTYDGPDTIDTSEGDQVVTFIVEAEDDMELYDASMWVGDPSSNRSVYWTDDGYEGTDNSGKFTFEVIIPQFSEPGTWTLSEVTVRDHLMKRTDLNSSDLATQGWNHTFENQQP